MTGEGCRPSGGCLLYRAVGLTAEVRHLEEVNVRSSDYGFLEYDFV